MSLTTILLALRRYAWIPVVFTAAASLVMAAITLTSKPSYVATATVIAKNPENATDRPLSFPEVVTSNTVALRAIKTAHVSATVAELETSLSVVSGKSDIYQISIRNPDPATAAAVANAVATEAASYYQELAAGDTASIRARIEQDRADLNKRYLDAAQALLAFDAAHPTVVGNPALGAQRLQLQLDQQAASNAVLNFEAGITQGRVAQITIIRNFESQVLDPAAAIPAGGRQFVRVAYAGGLGLLLGLIAVFLLAYFAPSIDEPEAAEAYFGAPIVGVIPRATTRNLRQAAPPR